MFERSQKVESGTTQCPFFVRNVGKGFFINANVHGTVGTEIVGLIALGEPVEVGKNNLDHQKTGV
ncbi:hypothetical protein LEP1GSC059_1282 [Leptospira noguchii serovar Panama str. CZ214]|uniref:Uncharacterized protein n=1 Tax=Leptospira noguchii serovar Panama str. CZ214 TaxID=1001595 RepID=T0FLW9_9LEPT|nr:hypothetical protein LEP1GSC059_1282 [Leptospira noguchii serovar Panama str. CZ214]